MPLALSTSWNAYRYTEARSMLFEISKLNFRNIELSFNLTDSMVREIPKAAKELGITITSLHNYCPIPEGFSREKGLPDCYSISSLNPQEKALALRYTKKTIDTAESLGACVVVLHCGRVEIEDKTKELVFLYQSNKKEDSEFKRIKEVFLQERSNKAGPFLESAISSLKELSLYAKERGVLLGIENRVYYREIPDFDEIGIILNKLSDENVFYWHDTGHAKVMQNLGFIEGRDYLKEYSGRLIGVHLHNVIGCLDHQPLKKGDLDFSYLKPYLNKETHKVIEVHKPATARDIEESKSLLEGIFNDII